MTALYPATYQSREDQLGSTRIIEVRAPQRPEIRTATPKSSNNMRYESEESDENSSKVSSSQSSPDSKGSQYLQDVLGDVLAEALSMVAKDRPPDPIQFIADYLHSVRDQRAQSGNIPIPSVSDSELILRDSSTTFENEFVKAVIVTPPPEDEDVAQLPLQSRLDTQLDEVEGKTETQYEPDSKTRKSKKKLKPPGGTQSEPPVPASQGPFQKKKSLKKERKTQSEKKKKSEDELSKKLSKNLEVDPILSEGKNKHLITKRMRSPTGRLTFSRRVPAAALTKEEYRLKRGLPNKLPPMSESPRTDAKLALKEMFEETRKASITGMQKPKQLAPIDTLEINMEKHRRRNKKLIEHKSSK